MGGEGAGDPFAPSGGGGGVVKEGPPIRPASPKWKSPGCIVAAGLFGASLAADLAYGAGVVLAVNAGLPVTLLLPL